MADDKLQIWNMALGFIKNTNSVQDENEQTPAAKQCRIYYDSARGTVLRDHLWNFARKQDTLAITGEAPTGWQFQYAYPSDCIKLNRIYNPVDPQDIALDRLPFEVASNPDGAGKVIWANLEEAELIYGINVDDTTKFEPDFDLVLALYLGHFLALAIANNSKRAGELRLLYHETLNRAETNNAREGVRNVDILADTIAARQ